MHDLTLQDHVRVMLSEYTLRHHLVVMPPHHIRELARLVAAHVQEVFIDAPEALPTDDVPGDLPVQTIIRHALHYIERETPAERKADGEYRTVTDNLRARLSLKS